MYKLQVTHQAAEELEHITDYGVAICKLCLLYWYRNCPEEVRVHEINQRDERSQRIRNKAKAKCADIMKWVIMGKERTAFYF